MEASKLRREKGWTIIDDSGRGFRRVVPSPDPVKIVESDAIKELFDHGVIVIASGGGGVPFITDDHGKIKGVDAVIDKDLSAATFATLIEAEILLTLTDVEKVSLNYGKPTQKELDHMTINDAKKYAAQGQFRPRSMGPKIESAIRFIESGGEKTVITSIDLAKDGLEGKAGTTISR